MVWHEKCNTVIWRNDTCVVLECINYIRTSSSQNHHFQAVLEKIEINILSTSLKCAGSAVDRRRRCHLKFLSRGSWILSGVWDFIGRQGLPREHTQDLIILNLKLHGSGQLITAAYETVKAFPKLIVEKTQLSAKKKKKKKKLTQHADVLWRRPQRSAVMNMPLLLEMYCHFAGCKAYIRWHFLAVCRPLLSWCGECPKPVAERTYWLAVQ